MRRTRIGEIFESSLVLDGRGPAGIPDLPSANGRGKEVARGLVSRIPIVLTIFTSPKAFKGHIGIIQRNAIRSWLSLAPDIQVLIIGDEEGVADAARAMGVVHLPDVERNDLGTPLVTSIFHLARQEARQPTLCYVNADVIFMDDLLSTTRRVAGRFDRFLIVGQRWDISIDEEIEFTTDWVPRLRARLATAGRLHPPAGSDYFVFTRDEFLTMPPFALGRAGWDNWMIYAGRSARIPVIDGSHAITAIHQDHDYSHLPGGQPHYRLPESTGNVLLAGGREAIFTLADASWREERGEIRRVTPRDVGVLRWLESSSIALVGAGPLAELVGTAFHPIKACRRFYRRASRRVGRLLGRLRRPMTGHRE